MPDQIEFAEYLVERIKQVGVKQVFGVPGDYNLELLDYFERDDQLEWVGNANELNAAYAADGYSRIKGSLAVLITTFGVGELSALCGVAGSLAERLPVLHIVGSPSTKMQEDHALLHHTLNTPGTFSAFADMSRPLSCAHSMLNSVPSTPDTAYTDELDRVLRACLTECRPGYLELPMDVVRAMVSTKGLKTPLPHPRSAPPFQKRGTVSNSVPPISSLSLAADTEHANDEVTEHVVQLIGKVFSRAERPIVLVDACCERFGMAPTVRKLVESAGIRFFSTPMGKSILNEHHPLFGGVYAGENSLKPVKDEVENADFVLYVGSLKSDFNSGSFSVNIREEVTVKLHSWTTNVGYANFPTTDIRHVLPRLVPLFDKITKGGTRLQTKGESVEEKIKQGRVMPLKTKAEGNEIVHKWFWGRMGSWFKDNDVIVCETGTSSFGLLPIPIPSHATYVCQTLWGAIGWSVGALLGVAFAAREREDNPRTVLFVGDGSLQLTVQEIGTMVRRKLTPYIFVLNNDGYEIERQIHGENAKYNEIQMYDHQLLLPFLAGKKPPIKHESHEVHSQAELDTLLADPAFNVPDRIRLIEVYMPRGDAPLALVQQAKLTAKANAGA